LKIIEYGEKIGLEEIKNIVIEFPFGLGDKIMSFPLLFSLKKQTKAKIYVLSPNTTSTKLLSLNPYIDEIIEYKLPKFKYKNVIKFLIFGLLKLRKIFKEKKIDLFICTHYNILRKIMLKTLPYKYGIINYANKHKGLQVKDIMDFLGLKTYYDHSIKMQDNKKEVLKKYKLKEKNYIVLDIYPQHLEKDPRRWYYFDELIEELKKNKENIVIIGLNKKHKERTDIIDLINKTGFEELLVIINSAKLVISLDTFNFHLSYSLNTPVIGLFGPTNPDERIPLNNNSIVYTIYKKTECSPCIINKVDIKCKNNYKCMKNIKPNDVKILIEKILK